MNTPDPASETTHPAPSVSPIVRPASIRTRLFAVLVFASCAGVLAIAAWLKPDARGYGTHEQLGGAPCGLLVRTGLPCPTCGMTTAFAFFMRGNWLRSVYAQPTGFLLALATAAMALLALRCMLTGRAPRLNFWVITPYRIFATLLILLIGGWAAKIAIGLLDGSLPFRA